MASIIKFKPFSGVYGHAPLCYILTIDNVRILLDCGWDEKFDMDFINELKKHVHQINAVLISYGDTAHCGALPYLVGKLGLKCPIYATVPVSKMGQLALYDALQGKLSNEDFDLFSFDDIDAVFDRVEQLKYNQTALLRGDNGLQITALPAGHMLGGSIWRITKMGDEEIVYAVDYNHKRERHLNGCTFDGVGRPALMITDAFNAIYNQPRRKNRDEQLVNQLVSTMRDGGDCLVVIDTAGRVLELAHLLDQLWQNSEAGLSTYNLVMLSSVASSVIEAAKSQIEWMADKIQRDFETGRVNPFHLKSVRCCHSMSELNRVRSPKVVLASGLDMESGFSRELFLDWCIETRNMCIITGRSSDSSLGSKLIKMAELRDAKKPCNNTIALEIKQRVKLDGAELAAYFEKRKAEHEEAKKKRQEMKRRKERDEILDESDSDDEDAAAAARAVAEASARVAQEEREKLEREANINGKDKEDVTMDQVQQHTFPTYSTHRRQLKLPLSVKMAYGDYLTYFHGPDSENHSISAGPFTRYGGIRRKKIAFSVTVNKPVPWDDYGELIDPEDYTIVEELKGHINEHAGNSDESEIENDNPFVFDDVPTKCIMKRAKIEVSCKLHFIDFEGRSDGESVRKLLERLQPRKLVVVHGNTSSTKNLSDYCVQNKIVEDIHAPYVNETVDATVESRIIQVKLSEHLMKTLKFHKIRDVEVCWINAKLVRRDPFSRKDEPYHSAPELITPIENVNIDDEEDAVESMEVDEDGETMKKRAKQNAEDERILVLETLPPAEQLPHRSLYIDDPKLSDIKTLLNSKGYQGEFHSGTLFVENVAAIQRTTAGTFSVEGRTSLELYRIRDLLKSQFAII
uniref:Cleavage and polyadenylation specificity factor subunit 2 n=1 Tax=Panagrolaimus superbus TaxID=310955 RepID=A0A914Y4Q4_9BILA